MTEAKKKVDSELEDLRADCIRLAQQNARYEAEILELRRERHVLLAEMKKSDERCRAIASAHEQLLKEISSGFTGR